jgi:hypothetical protein
MRLEELNKLALDLMDKKQKLNELKEIYGEHQKGSALTRVNRYTKLSRITGRKIKPAAPKTVEVEKTEKEYHRLQFLTKKMEHDLAKGLMEAQFNIKEESLEPTPVNNIATFELTPAERGGVLAFINETLTGNKSLPLVVDDIIFDENKITVPATSTEEAINQLAYLHAVICLVGKILYGEEAKDVKVLRGHLKNSKYRVVWDKLVERGSLTQQEIFEIARARDEKSKMRVFAFLEDINRKLSLPSLTRSQDKIKINAFGRLLAYTLKHSMRAKAASRFKIF